MKTNKINAENAQGAEAANAVAEKAEVKMTQAGLMDAVLAEGGTWAEMVAKAVEKAAALQVGGKYTAGLLRGHLKYRVQTQNKAWAKALVQSEEGIAPVKK
jgi:hypothetical protein